jgi:MFS transporter, CP family, cyanate transporter
MPAADMPTDCAASGSSGSPPDPDGRLIAAAVVLLALNLRTLIASLPPLLPDIRDDLHLSATVAGLLTTLPVVCFGAFAPVLPRLARRVSLEGILAGCAVVTIVAAALRGAGTTGALFVGSLLAGVAVAIAQGALPILIRTRFTAHTGRLMGAYSMALPLGATLAAAAAVPLAHLLGHSWPRSLAFWLVPAVPAALVWSAIARGGRTLLEGPASPSLHLEPLAWSVALYFGFQSAGFYAGLAWIPEILVSNDYSETSAGALQAVGSLVSMAPAFAVPILAARLGHQLQILIAVVAAASAGVLGLLVAPSAGLLWVALIGVGQGGMLGLALILPVLRARSAQSVASLTAMALCVGYIVAAAGPWILGLVHDASGSWSAALVAFLIITLAQLAPGAHACRARLLG